MIVRELAVGKRACIEKSGALQREGSSRPSNITRRGAICLIRGVPGWLRYGTARARRQTRPPSSQQQQDQLLVVAVPCDAGTGPNGIRNQGAP